MRERQSRSHSEQEQQKTEEFEIFRWIHNNSVPGGASSYIGTRTRSRGDQFQSLCWHERKKENRSRVRQYHTVLMLRRKSLLASDGHINRSWRVVFLCLSKKMGWENTRWKPRSCLCPIESPETSRNCPTFMTDFRDWRVSTRACNWI